MLAAALVIPFFATDGVRRQVFVLIGTCCVMAAVLLPLGEALAVAFTATCVDFVRRRYLRGNMATLAGLSGFANAITSLWAVAATSAVVSALDHQSALARGLLPLAAAGAFVTVGESSFATQIHLGWGYRFRDLLTARALSIELGLACLGACGAFLWRVQPWSALTIIAPLAVIRAALRLPFLEERARLADLDRAAKERLVELDHMKQQLIALVSHELRTPIISIGGYTELMLEGLAGDITNEQREYLQIVQRNSGRLGRLVDDLVQIEEVKSGLRVELAVVDLHRIVREATAAAGTKAEEEGIAVHVSSEGSCLVHGDQSRLGQVVDNLISNAIKYAAAGGSIDIRLSSDGRVVILEVEDHGPGISPEDQARLFSPFFRTPSAIASNTPGSGLGLSIVKSIIEQHQGEIVVNSTLHQGTTFRITLPAFDPGGQARQIDRVA
jgi:signal transduction histidine kinase